MDVSAWLRGLGLERYEADFRDNEITWAVLPKLTADDLKDIGVTAVGHRRMLLEAIAALGAAAATTTPTAAVSDASATAEAERRQLTVMFCDLVGSTPLSTRFDPEDLREIVGAYHRCVADTVGRFGGFVAKYMGDGVLVYFGYPEAHEDDAERAVRAGLAVIDAVGRLAIQEPLNTGNLRRFGAPSAEMAPDNRAISVLYEPIPYALGTGNLFRPNRELNGGIRELFGRIREEALGSLFFREVQGKGPRRYCRPGVLSVNPARRNASAIASPLTYAGLLEPARVSAGWRRFSDPAGAISARAVVGRASGV